MPARGSGKPRKYTFVDSSGKRQTRWRFRETLEDGVKVTTYGTTDREVRQKHKARLTQIDDGLLVGRTVPRFAGLVDQALAAMPNRWAGSTRISYTSLLTRHAVPAWGHRAIPSITPGDAASLIRTMNDRYADGTARNLRAALQYVFDFARQQRWLRDNPARDLRLDPQGKTVRPPQPLAIAQCRALLTVARTDSDPRAPIVVAILLLGLRNGEACGLRWADCTLDGAAPQIRVAGQLGYTLGKGWAHTTATKTKGSHRAIVIDAYLARQLAWHQQATDATRAAHGYPALSPEDHLFTRADGQTCTPAHVRAIITRLGAAAGILKITPHWFRHTAATLANEAGHTLEAVAAGLGHANTKITGKVYVHTEAPPSTLGLIMAEILQDDRRIG